MLNGNYATSRVYPMKTRTDILLNACCELALTLADTTSNLQLADNDRDRFLLRREINTLLKTYNNILKEYGHE